MPEQESFFVDPSYRWVARIIDFGLYTPLALIIFVPSVLVFDSIIDDVSGLTFTTFAISGAIFLFLLIVIDTLIGTMFGNTLGKSLMKILVTESDGAALTFSRRFKRNIGVATVGYGWSIPFFGWLLMFTQYFLTRKGKPTIYDKANGFSVRKFGTIERWHGFLCFLIFIFALSFQAISTKVANKVLNPHGWYFGLQAIGEAQQKSAPHSYDPARDPFTDFIAAKADAKAQNKLILLEFGGDWCIWCHRLDTFISEQPEISKSMSEVFIVLKVNVSEENSNEKFLKKFSGIPGYPHFIITSSSGKELGTMNTSTLEMGNSYSLPKMKNFIEAWKQKK